MTTQDFTTTFYTSQSPETVFDTLKNVRQWWRGFYDETIEGTSDQLNESFTFLAGGGAHYSRQQLIELVPNKKIVWLVTESNLSFLEKKDEWVGTTIIFDMEEVNGKTQVRFTHKGLVPSIECFNACSNGWSQYLQQLSLKLNQDAVN